jgi:hypothetical protein
MIAWAPLYIGSSRSYYLSSSVSKSLFVKIFVYLPYLVVALCLFISFAGLPELHQPIKKIVNRCYRIKHNRVHVMPLILN